MLLETVILDGASSADWPLAALADEPVGQPVTLANRNKYLDCLFHDFFDCSEQVIIPYASSLCIASRAVGLVHMAAACTENYAFRQICVFCSGRVHQT